MRREAAQARQNAVSISNATTHISCLSVQYDAEMETDELKRRNHEMQTDMDQLVSTSCHYCVDCHRVLSQRAENDQLKRHNAAPAMVSRWEVTGGWSTWNHRLCSV